MPLTALDLSTDGLQAYHPMEAIRARKGKIGAELSKRRRLASLTARKAAQVLRNEFDAQKVILFGSLARRGSFSLYSDIDLAVRGIAPEKFYAAVSAMMDVSVDFKIDLVEPEDCSPAMFKNIEKDGKPL